MNNTLHLLLNIVLICTLYRGVYSGTTTLSVDNDDCSPYKIRHVNKDEKYEIVWNGGEISDFCTFGFVGRDSGYMNEYKVCVEAITFRVSNCDVKMKYEKGVGENLYSTYSCNDEVSRFCGDSDDYVDIDFSSDFIQPTDNAGKITLKVTADMTYNYAVVVGCSVAGSIVGVVVLSCIVVVLVRATRRSRDVGRIVQENPSSFAAPATVYTYQHQGIDNTANRQYTYGPPPSYQTVVTSSGNLTSPTAGNWK